MSGLADSSICRYPVRGHGGKSGWLGNSPGDLTKDIITFFKPKVFVDVCEGSGTSRDVCEKMGIEYYGYDLHTRTDFTHDYIRGLTGKPADVCFSHPPYGKMIDYRRVSTFQDPSLRERDTSACETVDEFLEKSMAMLLNQREATRSGGHYMTLIGDMRKKGVFRSFQSDFIQMMPTSELLSVVIKEQFNCTSDRRRYSGSFIPIRHEYLIIWKKSDRTMVHIAVCKAMELKNQTSWTWKNLLRQVMMKHFGSQPTPLQDIYAAVEKEAGNELRSRPNWMAKIRQVLQEEHIHVSRGLWAAA